MTLWGSDVFRPAGAAAVLFFISTDCPVSNGYAPEIQRICAAYRRKGVSCTLVYEDVDLKPVAVERHLSEFGYSAMPALIDASRTIARRARATVTPEAVLVDARGAIRYRGRINNFYAALGKPRRQVTENNLVDALDAVLDGRIVSVPETKPLGCFIVDPETLMN
jgi:hypothetical protein